MLPYYEKEVWPRLKKGENVLVAAHGNSIRALIMHLEGLSPTQIIAREVATGVPIVYRLTDAGSLVDKRELVA